MPLARTPTRWQPRHDAAPKPSAVEKLASALNVSSLAARLLLQRGLDANTAPAFLKPKLTDLPDPAELGGCESAAKHLADTVHAQRPVVIYGDYDVDGISATAILYHTLVELHHTLHGTHRQKTPVATYVPHRIDEGYGLNPDALDAIAQYTPFPKLQPDDEQPPLVVTVDCGITACDAAQHAKSIGLPLIITDHHLFDDDALPEALTLVHPGLTKRGKPRKTTQAKSSKASTSHNTASDTAPCGAGVAFNLAWQTARTALEKDRLPADLQKLMVELLSLAALGTVADLVPLAGANRAITATGLARIKQTRFVGLNAMIDAAGLRDDREKVDAYHVGFVLGPRLNACGRMGHARQAVELLTTADGSRARELAAFLTKQNDQRRAEERRVFDAACERVESEGHDAPDRRAIVLDDPDWHPGVVGIVASRLVERFHRPVVLLTHDDSGLTAKGSARSVPEVHVQQAFCACAKHLAKFGGHAMAAGLTLDLDRIDDFREALIDHVNAILTEDDLAPRKGYDADAEPDDLHTKAFRDIEKLAPFGQGNPAPRLRLCDAVIERPPRRVGRAAAHLTLQLRVGDRSLRGIAFGRGPEGDTLGVGDRLDVLFEPKLNTWNGVTRPEMNIVDFRVAD